MSDLGRDYETSLDPTRRRRDGVHYTPRAIADELVERAFKAHLSAIASEVPFSVCDPTCGAGVFLLAAADALVARGRTPFAALACLRGMDIDPEALEVARAELLVWARTHGVSAELPSVLVVGDDSPFVEVAFPFRFFGTDYRTVFVNNNGLISLFTSVSSFVAQPFPISGAGSSGMVMIH